MSDREGYSGTTTSVSVRNVLNSSDRVESGSSSSSSSPFIASSSLSASLSDGPFAMFRFKKTEIRRPEPRRSSLSTNLDQEGNINSRVEVMENRLSLQKYQDTYLQKCMKALHRGVRILKSSIGYMDNAVLSPSGIISGHQDKIYCQHWSGNNEDFVSCSFDGKMLIWNKNDMADPRLVVLLRSPWVMGCAFEQTENNMVASGGLDNVCTVYRIPTFVDVQIGAGSSRTTNENVKIYLELFQHTKYISSMKFAGPHRLITASGDKTCIHWDLETGTHLNIFEGHTADVMSVSNQPTISKDIFASGSCDGQVLIWDLRQGTEAVIGIGSRTDAIGRLRSRPDVNAVHMFLGTTAVCTAGEDGMTRVFDMRAATEPKKDRKTNVIISSNQRTTGRSPVGIGMNTGMGAGLLRENIVAPIDKSEFKSFFVPNEFSPVTCIDTGRSGRVVYSGYESKGLRVWDILSPNDESLRTPLQTLKPHVDKLTCMGVSPDGETLATGGWDKQLKIYQVQKLDDLSLNTTSDISRNASNANIEGGINTNDGYIEDDRFVSTAASATLYNSVSQSDVDNSNHTNSGSNNSVSQSDMDNSNHTGINSGRLNSIETGTKARSLNTQVSMIQEHDDEEEEEEEEEGEITESNAIETQKPQPVVEVEMTDKG